MTQKPAKPTARAKRETAATVDGTKRGAQAKRATAATAAEPAKRTTAAGAAARAKPAVRPSSERKPQGSRRSPSYDEICERAYFISLEQGGGDEVANWLRAERELATA